MNKLVQILLLRLHDKMVLLNVFKLHSQPKSDKKAEQETTQM